MKYRPAWTFASAVVVLTALFFGYEVPDRIKIDGASVELIGLMTLMNTQYSDDYSHAGFRQIRRGNTEQDVLDILGEPLKRIGPYADHPCGTTECPPEGSYLSLVYSMPPNLRNTNYRARYVTLNSGVVVEIHGRFSAD